jgi:hypothetical protein
MTESGSPGGISPCRGNGDFIADKNRLSKQIFLKKMNEYA